MEKESCATCFKASKIEPGQGSLGGLVCRANPPTPFLLMEPVPPSIANPKGGQAMVVRGFHTPVKDEQWCAQWKGRMGMVGVAKPN